MSSRTSRKSAHPRAKAPEPIITRNKSAQQKRQLRKKEAKKTEKPELTKPESKSPKPPETKSTKTEAKSLKPETKSPKTETKSTKPETKSPKVIKTVKRSQVSLLKPVEILDDDLEQIEYYPNRLKREFRAKKIMLKPKHNFKVVAATNKRKMATPQRGIKSPTTKNSSSPKGSKVTRTRSPELSMQDMVRMMEDTRSLSDEDFMEILTCPSPVWWEDPPDGGFDEGSIHTRMPKRPKKLIKETNNKKRKLSTNITSKSKNRNIIIDLVDDTDTEPPKRKAENTDEKFVKKKQKLENILGNIKKKVNQPKKNCKNGRKISESEDFSDLSFNEEEILKNLENMDIPVQDSLPESTDDSLDAKNETEDMEMKEESIDTHENEIVDPKNGEADRGVPSPNMQPIIQEVYSIKNSVFDSCEFKSGESLDEVNVDSKSEDVVVLDSCNNSSLGNNEDSSSVIDLIDNSSNSEMGKKTPIDDTKIISDVVKTDDSSNQNSDVIKDVDASNGKSDALKNVEASNKKPKVLSEYINVYKITPEKINNDNSDNESKPTENTAITKIEAVRGRLNYFFKQCKSSKRLKKSDMTVPANPVTDVKVTPIEIKNEIKRDGAIDSEDEKNRLNSYDYHVQKTENAAKEFFFEKCDLSPTFPCGLCNFQADTKEVYIKHISSCKDVARIKWNHNYVLNQT